MDDDTIIQLATARQIAAIHILRISGEKSLIFLKNHTRLAEKKIIARHCYCTFFFQTPQRKKIIDKVLVIYFPAPNSFSGEDMAEIHCHGSPYIVEKIMQTALAFGLRPALAGEFTRRAFYNGKISAEEAEATNAFIHAETDAIRDNALAIIEGKASLKFSDLQKKILTMMAYLESSIEFPEEDLPEIDYDKSVLYQQYQEKLCDIYDHLFQMIQNYDRGKKSEKGFRVIISGAPNAGKSTLLNELLRENRAIVSAKAGSTRDYLHEQISIKNHNFSVYDTAGLRTKTKDCAQNLLDPLEKEGIAKSYELLKESDIVIYMICDEKEVFLLEEVLGEIGSKLKNVLFLINKIDLLRQEKTIKIKKIIDKIAKKKRNINKNIFIKSLSLKEKNAVKEVETILVDYACKKTLKPQTKNNVFLVSQRQKYLCVTLLEKMKTIKKQLAENLGEEIILEGFKSLREIFAELNLEVSNEKIFDEIFSQFCLGK